MKQLKKYSNKIFKISGKATYESIAEIMFYKPNIIFLDIEEYNYLFFSLVNFFRKDEHEYEIVFLVSNNDSRIDLLLKYELKYIIMPGSDSQVKEIMSDYKRAHCSEGGITEKCRSCSKLAAYKDEHIHVLELSDIYYFFAESGQSKIMTKAHDEYINKYPLKYWEDKLSAKQFIRCHRSYIINLDYIHQIIPWYNNTLLIGLKNSDYQVPISRSYTKEIRRLLSM